MAAVTITIHMRWCAAATVSSRGIFISRGVRPPRGAPVRHHSAAEQDSPHQHDRTLMPERLDKLQTLLEQKFDGRILRLARVLGEVTLEIAPGDLLDVARTLR